MTDERPQFSPTPQNIEPFLNEYFRQIAQQFHSDRTEFTFFTVNAEPTKKWDGLTVLADGTNWNPGAGQGVYTYYNAAWNKLG